MLGVTKAIGGLPTVNIRLHQYSVNRKLKTLLKKPLFSGCFLYAYHAPSLQNCIPGLLMVTSHISFQRNHFPVNPKSIRARKEKKGSMEGSRQIGQGSTDRPTCLFRTNSQQSANVLQGSKERKGRTLKGEDLRLRDSFQRSANSIEREEIHNA